MPDAAACRCELRGCALHPMGGHFYGHPACLAYIMHLGYIWNTVSPKALSQVLCFAVALFPSEPALVPDLVDRAMGTRLRVFGTRSQCHDPEIADVKLVR